MATVDELAERLEAALGRIDQLEREVETLKHGFSARFDAIDVRLGDIRQVVISTRGDIASLAEGQARTARAIEGLVVKVETMDQRDGDMVARIGAHDGRFDQIDARSDAHDARFDSVDAALTEILRRLPAPGGEQGD